MADIPSVQAYKGGFLVSGVTSSTQSDWMTFSTLLISIGLLALEATRSSFNTQFSIAQENVKAMEDLNNLIQLMNNYKNDFDKDGKLTESGKTHNTATYDPMDHITLINNQSGQPYTKAEIIAMLHAVEGMAKKTGGKELFGFVSLMHSLDVALRSEGYDGNFKAVTGSTDPEGVYGLVNKYCAKDSVGWLVSMAALGVHPLTFDDETYELEDLSGMTLLEYSKPGKYHEDLKDYSTFKHDGKEYNLGPYSFPELFDNVSGIWLLKPEYQEQCRSIQDITVFNSETGAHEIQSLNVLDIGKVVALMQKTMQNRVVTTSGLTMDDVRDMLTKQPDKSTKLTEDDFSALLAFHEKYPGVLKAKPNAYYTKESLETALSQMQTAQSNISTRNEQQSMRTNQAMSRSNGFLQQLQTLLQTAKEGMMTAARAGV